MKMHTSKSDKRIAVIVNRFPVLSETFIVNEIKELVNSGLRIDIYSLFFADKAVENNQVSDLKEKTVYYIPNLGIGALVKSHLAFLVSHPVRYFNTLYYAFRKGNKKHSVLKTLYQMVVNREIDKNSRQNIFLHFFLVLPLAREIQKKGFHLIHCHFLDAAASLTLLISKLTNKPYGATAHAYDIFTHQENFVEKIENAAFVITCTHYNKQYIKMNHKNIDVTKIHVIYHGINLEKFNRKKRPAKNPPVILSVGRFVPKKGFMVLLQACKILKEKRLQFKCRIIGDGPDRPKYEMFIKLYDLMDSIELVGFVAPSEIIDEYENASVFTLPCIVEEDGNRDGIPNVVAEAMAMRLPVVSTRVSAIPELVEDGKTGILLEPGDSEGLAETLETLLNKRNVMGLKGRQKVETVFDSTQTIKSLVTFFNTFLDANSEL